MTTPGQRSDAPPAPQDGRSGSQGPFAALRVPYEGTPEAHRASQGVDDGQPDWLEQILTRALHEAGAVYDIGGPPSAAKRAIARRIRSAP